MERAASSLPSPRPLVLWAHALSLDTVAGVLAACWLVSVALEVTLPPAWWGVLALSCWGVYLIDHLLDAARLLAAPGRRRAPFAGGLGRWFGVATAALVVDLLLAATLPPALVVNGLLVLPAVALHLWVAQQEVGPPKELTATCVYLLALWFAPLTLAPSELRDWAPLFVAHGAAALANLAATSAIDEALDRAEGQRSLATRFGRRVAVGATWLAASVGLLAAFRSGHPVAIAFAGSACFPLLCLHLGPRELARSAIDLSFVLAALLVALS